MNSALLTISNIRSVLNIKNYFFDDRVGALNIIGIRNTQEYKPNRFNDLIALIWTDLYRIQKLKIVTATTLPGTPYLLKPINKKGTAILVEGQYKDTYAVDVHNGKYQAICQRLKPVSVYRDGDKDSEFDYTNSEKGMFGINIHRANQFVLADIINWYSAGCQVVANKQDFDFMMSLAKQHKDLFGNVFTYTLIRDTDFNI